MNTRVANMRVTRVTAMWDGRCAPWLQPGATPGSVRTKAPPRVQRSGRGPLPWPPHVWAFAVVARL